ncbi:MAG: TIGR02265 family protein [Cystobacter sp.]
MVPGSGDEWVSDLATRLALATPSDRIRGMFVRSVQEVLGVLGDEALLRRCHPLWAREPFVELFYYPIRLQLEVLALVIEPLGARHGGRARVLRMMGLQCARDFLASYTGRALRVSAGGEPKRMVELGPTGYQFAVSGGTHALRWLGPTRCVWSMRRDFMPAPFHEGIILGLLKESRAREVRVHGEQVGMLDGDYDISWR